MVLSKFKYSGSLCFLVVLLVILSSCSSASEAYQPLFDEEYLSGIESISFLYSSDIRYELTRTQGLVFDDAIVFLQKMRGVACEAPDESGHASFLITVNGEEHEMRLLSYHEGCFVMVDDTAYRVETAFSGELPTYFRINGEKIVLNR